MSYISRIIEDEIKAQSIFFRKRLSYKAKAYLVETDESLIDAFKDRLGSMVDTLFKMDFVILKIELIEGKYNIGPGQAYHISKEEKITSLLKLSKGHQVT